MMRAHSALAGLGAASLVVAVLATGFAVPAAAQQAPQGAMPPPAGSVTGAPDDATVRKAGAALEQVAQIQQDYEQRMKSAQTKDQQQGLTRQAHAAAVQAINNRGLSVGQYNQVIRKAQADPDTKRRLLAAAQQAH